MNAPYTPPPVYAGKWTDELDDEVRRLQSKGFSFQDIAMRLRCSRNAVIGRAHRIGLSSHAARIWTRAEDTTLAQLADAKKTRIEAASELGCSFCAVTARAKKLGIRFSQSNRGSHGSVWQRHIKTASPISAPPRAVQDPPSPNSLGLTFMQLEFHHCRFPLGERDYTFCGAPRTGGSSYCCAHHALATVPYVRNLKKLRAVMRGAQG
jgi:hypothetical protein